MKITVKHLIGKTIVANKNNSLEIYNFLIKLKLTDEIYHYYSYKVQFLNLINEIDDIYFKVRDSKYFVVSNLKDKLPIIIDGNTFTRKNKLKNLL